MTPRLVAPVRALTQTYQIIDNKYGRPAGAYATLGEARAARAHNRRRPTSDTVCGPRFRAGPCIWCGWTSTLHTVKAAVAVVASRHHRDRHTLDAPGPR